VQWWKRRATPGQLNSPQRGVNFGQQGSTRVGGSNDDKVVARRGVDVARARASDPFAISDRGRSTMVLRGRSVCVCWQCGRYASAYSFRFSRVVPFRRDREIRHAEEIAKQSSGVSSPDDQAILLLPLLIPSRPRVSHRVCDDQRVLFGSLEILK